MSARSSLPTTLLGTTLMFLLISAQADEPELVEKRTTVGHEVRVGNHAHWNGNCTATIVPSAKVIDPPSHGHVDLREGDFTVNSMRTGPTPCNGVTMNGRLVYYVPDPGFIGDDSFSYDMRIKTGGYPFRINVKISVEGPAAASTPSTGQ